MDSLKKRIYSLHTLERKVLPLAGLQVSEIEKKTKLSAPEINKAVLMLEANKLVEIEKSEQKEVVLDKLGEKFKSGDFPEIKLLRELDGGSKKMSELKIPKDEVGSALGIVKREGLVDIKKDGEMVFTAKPGAKEYVKSFKNPLKQFEGGILVSELSAEQKQIFENLKQRKFLREQVCKKQSVKLTSEGKKVAQEIEKKYKNIDLVEAVDSEMLKTRSWKGKEFRHYDTSVEVPMPEVGRRHPMLEANDILRDVFVEMGFKEMQGPMVESAFWNMDVMWIPQDHPARDEQDTFYLEGKAKVPADLMKKVKNMHEKGIKRTHTTKGDWSEEITCKRLLRTHSTATSFRTLSELGKKLAKGEDINGKYFYVANVFRNEAIDATHLAEFYQAEGFIIGDELSLADLMGFIKEYYSKLGIDKIRFKPTFNPYTEPSMEAHYFDESMGKWYALINSGIFRQETLEPMGLKGKSIIAWGMGASRIAALLAGKASMRDITGTTCDFGWMRERPQMKRSIVSRGGEK